MRGLRDVILQDFTVGVFEIFGVVERKDEVVAGSEPIELEFRRWTAHVAGRIPVGDSRGRFGQALRNGENHGVAREVVMREAIEAGYQLLEQDDFVKDGMDYFLVFGAKK